MSEPAEIEPDPEPYAEDDDATVLPVQIDLEDPEADTLDQAVAVELDVEGYGYS